MAHVQGLSLHRSKDGYWTSRETGTWVGGSACGPCSQHRLSCAQFCLRSRAVNISFATHNTMDRTQETETRGGLRERSGVGKEEQFQDQVLEGWRGKAGHLYLQILRKGAEASKATAENCYHRTSSCLQGALVMVDCGAQTHMHSIAAGSHAQDPSS